MSPEALACLSYRAFTRRTRSGVIGSGPWSTHTIVGRCSPPAFAICSVSCPAAASYRWKYSVRALP
jgi:hypothetical protein